MATAYIFFCRGFASDGTVLLVNACRTLIGEADAGKHKWDRIHLSIASGGGDVTAAFAAYNHLKGLPVPVDTHNAGATDSAAIMPFMAGQRRTASPASAFLFHQLQWTFASKDNLTATVIEDATKWLGTYETMMANSVASGTSMKQDEVMKMIREGTSVTADHALKLGLITAIEECPAARDDRWWTIS